MTSCVEGTVELTPEQKVQELEEGGGSLELSIWLSWCTQRPQAFQ